MASKRRRYTDEERASIVAMLASEGYPETKGALEKVAKYAGVPHPTLHRWFHEKQNPPPSEMVHIKKIELADLFEQVARKYLEHGLSLGVMDEVSGKDAVTAAAIAVDKMNLLRNKPTEHIAVEHSGQLTIEERRRAIHDILERDTNLRRLTGLSATDD